MTDHNTEPQSEDPLDPTEYNRTMGLFQKVVMKRGLFTRFKGDDFYGAGPLGYNAPVLAKDEQMGTRRKIDFQVGKMQTSIILNLHGSSVARFNQIGEHSGYQEAVELIEKDGLSVGMIQIGDLSAEDADSGRLGVLIRLHEKPAIYVTTDETIPGTTPERAAELQKFADFLGLDRRFATGERDEFDGNFSPEDLVNFSQGLERLLLLESNEVVL